MKKHLLLKRMISTFGCNDQDKGSKDTEEFKKGNGIDLLKVITWSHMAIVYMNSKKSDGK